MDGFGRISKTSSLGKNHWVYGMYDLSVIIATKNEKDYIEETLESLNQAMNEAEKKDVTSELIIIDNSDDDTLKIAKTFTHNAYHLPMGGVSKARNFGAKKSKGKILVFMDADTLIQKKTLIDIFRIFSNKKTVVAIITYVQPKHPSELQFSEKLFYVVDNLFIKTTGILGYLPHFYNRGDAVAIRKDTFNTIGGFDERLYIMEIADLLVKTSKHGSVRVLPSPVYDSARRLRTWGVAKSHKIWWKNYFAFYLRKRLHDATYEAVR